MAQAVTSSLTCAIFSYIYGMKRGLPLLLLLFASLSCSTPEERTAAGLARRIAPEYASRIVFRLATDSLDSYSIGTRGRHLLISGSNANAMAAGLGRYLRDVCGADVSWHLSQPVQLPSIMPLPDSTISSHALVPRRFFLNYCTFGYEMPWWQWEEWEHFIDWMALQGINLPLAITGQDAVWQEVWRKHGLTDEQIRAWFTGPAHLPWHRMCNIDGVDGPLPQGWIDAQERLQKRILQRERELGMKPVLPAFAGHVPAEFKQLYPSAKITDITHWGGFGPENLPHFLSPQDSLYAVIQKEFLEIQMLKYGTDHIYGFDLFNEVDPPSWDPQTLAEYGAQAYGTVAAVDPDAEWLQMGWMFYYDRAHWTKDNIEAYLGAIPQGKVTILDYYTENVPVWKLTDSFFGQPYVFCYLGNFGGNTRLAGPFHTESERITEALSEGGAGGIGCTLEAFGINRWLYEYVLERAWSGCLPDDEWLAGLDRRRSSPHGFWQTMADSIYVRGSFSEGVLICGRPCMEGFHSWRVMHRTPYEHATLERAWKRLASNPSDSGAWKEDAVSIGCQVLGNRFADLRDSLAVAYSASDIESVRVFADRMRMLLKDVDELAACMPQFRLDRWINAAQAHAAGPSEEYYYRHNAWHLITTWGGGSSLNDYASRLWSGLISHYYSARWELFLNEVLAAMQDGRSYDQKAFDERCSALEDSLVLAAPVVEAPAGGDVTDICNRILSRL